MDADTRQEAEARRETLSRGVAEDLEAIFRPAPVAPPLQPGKVQSFVPAEGARERSHAKLGALVAAALAGLALGGVLMGSSPHDPKPLTPASVAAAAPAASPTPVRVVEVAPTPLVPPTPPPAPTIRSAPVVAATTPVRPAKAATPKMVKAKARATAAGRCERLRGAAQARCAYPAVIAADRRLRAAYAKATRAGVSRQRLVSVRTRWASLRRQADDRPTQVIVAYDRMAADLTRAARQARS